MGTPGLECGSHETGHGAFRYTQKKARQGKSNTTAGLAGLPCGVEPEKRPGDQRPDAQMPRCPAWSTNYEETWIKGWGLFGDVKDRSFPHVGPEERLDQGRGNPPDGCKSGLYRFPKIWDAAGKITLGTGMTVTGRSLPNEPGRDQK